MLTLTHTHTYNHIQMLYEDSNKSHMSVDSGSTTNSPFKLSPVKILNDSWYDEIECSTAARSAMDVSVTQICCDFFEWRKKSNKIS